MAFLGNLLRSAFPVLLLAGLLAAVGQAVPVLPKCPLWRSERLHVVDADTLDLFVQLDFPRTMPEVVVAALVSVLTPWQAPDHPTVCMTIAQLLKVAAELGAPLSEERLLGELHQAQLRRICKLSRGRPAHAVALYAAAAAIDPHVSTYQLLLGSELASIGNLTGAAAVLTAVISSMPARAAVHADEIVRARLGLALALEALDKRRAPGDATAAGGDITGNGERAIAQYQELLSLRPDAQPLWYLLARALRRHRAVHHDDARSKAAMTIATRLFSSTRRAYSARALRTAVPLHDDARKHNAEVPRDAHTHAPASLHVAGGRAWENVEYLRGCRNMADAIAKYSAWQLRVLELAKAGGGGGSDRAHGYLL